MKKNTKNHHRSKHLKLAHHHHTGKPMPHGMTSYPALAILAFLSLCFFVGAAASARASTLTSSSSVTVQGVVPGPPPTSPAIMEGITNGQIVNSPTLTISGSCETNTIVKIFRNESIAGTGFCTSGSFTIPITLNTGENRLRARNYDTLDQAGPESNEILIIYQPSVLPQQDVPTNEGSLEIPATQQSPAATTATAESLMLLAEKCTLRGLKPRTAFSWSVEAKGGVTPYNLTVSWGDASSPLVKQIESTKPTDLEHSFARAGNYTIRVTAKDSTGQTATLQCTAIVDGYIPSPLGTIDTTTDAGDLYTRINELMPVYWAATGVLAIGWALQQASLQSSAGWLARLARKPFRFK